MKPVSPFTYENKLTFHTPIKFSSQMEKRQSKLVNALRSHDTVTENGAITHSTSLNAVVDMFFLAGASRNMSEKDIIRVFTAALIEDTRLACKCLFWSRDIRGGAGERKFFKICMNLLKSDYPKVWAQLFQFIPVYGYWKDLLSEETSKALVEFVASKLPDDGLLCKWMPRKGNWFNALRVYMKLTPKELRKMLVNGSKTVEQSMCANDWAGINYSHVPSIAFHNYKTAFFRHDSERFNMFLGAAVKGDVKVNAVAIFPYQLYQAYERGDDHNAIIAQWNNLKDYLSGTVNEFIPVCDVSGSMWMYGSRQPYEISISLGVYLSERNKGIFKDAFLTFNTKPEMHYLKGNVVERFAQLRKASFGLSTNLQATFDLILSAALKNKMAAAEMPKTLLIISDMEFNAADSGRTNLEAIRAQYEHAGYRMPKIAFWNVKGKVGNVPAQVKDKGVALISGASPAIVESVLRGKDFSPRGIMLEAIDSERYEAIEVSTRH